MNGSNQLAYLLHYTGLEKFSMNKDGSLLNPFVSYKEKKYCEYNTWTLKGNEQ